MVPLTCGGTGARVGSVREMGLGAGGAQGASSGSAVLSRGIFGRAGSKRITSCGTRKPETGWSGLCPNLNAPTQEEIKKKKDICRKEFLETSQVLDYFRNTDTLQPFHTGSRVFLRRQEN